MIPPQRDPFKPLTVGPMPTCEKGHALICLLCAMEERKADDAVDPHLSARGTDDRPRATESSSDLTRADFLRLLTSGEVYVMAGREQRREEGWHKLAVVSLRSATTHALTHDVVDSKSLRILLQAWMRLSAKAIHRT